MTEKLDLSKFKQTEVVLSLKNIILITNNGSEIIKFLKCSDVNCTNVEDIENAKEKFQLMFRNQRGVFAEPNEALPYNTNIIATIQTENEDPIYSKLYPCPMGVSDFVNSGTDAMLRDGIIRLSRSPYSHNPFGLWIKKGLTSREIQKNVSQ